MITERDLQEAIAECQGERNPNANTCLKLAAFYTIRREMFGNADPVQVPAQSFSSAPALLEEKKPTYTSDTEFGEAINGMDLDHLLPIIDELMTTLKVIQPRLYASVMRKIDD